MIAPALFGPQHHRLLVLLQEGAAASGSPGAVLLPRGSLRTAPRAGASPGSTAAVGTSRAQRELETRLADGTVLPIYDDWACLDDIAAAGWIRMVSKTYGLVAITEAGAQVLRRVAELRREGRSLAALTAPETD